MSLPRMSPAFISAFPLQLLQCLVNTYVITRQRKEPNKKRRLSALIMAKKAIFGLDLFIYDKSTRRESPQVGSLPHELFRTP